MLLSKYFLNYWNGWLTTFCFEQTILKLIFVELKVLNSYLINFMQRAYHRLSCL